MTTTSDSPEVELLHRAWEAMRRGDFAVLEDSLAEDAMWRSVEEGPTNCEGRGTIIEVMSRNLAGRLRGSIEERIQTGPRVLVAFRPEQSSNAGNRPLDDGIAYMVVTISDGRTGVDKFFTSDPQIAVSATRVRSPESASRHPPIRAARGLGRGCPPPGPNPQESPGNQREVRGAPSGALPANRRVFRPRSTKS
jgi:ketosteroid isomerase-like protein